MWVTSESDVDEAGVPIEYIVDLCEYPVEIPGANNIIFNGACGLTKERIHGCKDFIYRWEPMLKRDNRIIRRCKHLRAAREHALDLILPALKRADPNLDEDLTP